MTKHAINIFFIACFMCGATSFAESPEIPVMPNPKDAGIKFLLDVGKPTEVTPEEIENRLIFWISAGPSFSSYSLETSSQNNIKLPITRGVSQGLGIAYKTSATDRIRLLIRKNETEFATISGVTTTPLNVEDREGRLGYAAGIGRGFNLTTSYRYHDRQVREISPIAVMTGSVAHGLHLEVGWSNEQKNKWSISMRAGIFTPISFKEKFQETGKSRIRLYSDAGMQLMYSMGKGFEIGFSPSASIEYRAYSGVLNRAVRDAKERWIEFVAPVQLSASF